jgi:hypothetical protein
MALRNRKERSVKNKKQPTLLTSLKEFGPPSAFFCSAQCIGVLADFSTALNFCYFLFKQKVRQRFFLAIWLLIHSTLYREEPKNWTGSSAGAKTFLLLCFLQTGAPPGPLQIFFRMATA